MTKDNARKKAIRARMATTGEAYNVAGRHLEKPTGPATRPLPPDQGDRAEDSRNGLIPFAAWPEEPEPVDPGEGTRADRLRMQRHMRKVWNAFNAARRARVKAEVQAGRERQAEVTEYWDRHRALVKEGWANRTGGRGETTVADIPEVAAQWHPDNPFPAEKISATAQQRGAASPFLWRCPLGLGHASWPAWPKDRIQKGSGCPSCQKLVKLSDIPAMAEQYEGSVTLEEITYGANDEVPWVCRTWALDPVTGHWDRVEHHFKAVVKDRSQQGHGCRSAKAS